MARKTKENWIGRKEVPAGEVLIRQLEQLFPYAAVCETDTDRYAHTMGQSDEGPPERRLLIAVLLQAWKDIALPHRTRNGQLVDTSAQADAWSWVMARDRSDWFGFIPLCWLLKLDSGRVRQAFLKRSKSEAIGEVHIHNVLKYENGGMQAARLVA